MPESERGKAQGGTPLRTKPGGLAPPTPFDRSVPSNWALYGLCGEIGCSEIGVSLFLFSLGLRPRLLEKFGEFVAAGFEHPRRAGFVGDAFDFGIAAARHHHHRT